MTAPVDATTTSAWAELSSIRDSFTPDLRDWFAIDPRRAERLSFELADLHVDLSKNLVTDEILAALVRLAEETGVAERYAAMIAGEHINTTEDRAVLHTALRRPPGAEPALVVDGQDIDADVQSVLTAMTEFSTRVRSGEWTGVTGKKVTHIVNIGIGGSDLGPVMISAALEPYATAGIEARFVSNIDPTDLAQKTKGLDPETTLFIVASKTFTTLETLTNARLARDWLWAGLEAVGAIDGSDEAEDGCRRPPLRRRLDGARQGRRVRHRPRERLRVLGLGRRPLLRRLGHRPVAHDRARPRRLPRTARRLPRGRRARAHHSRSSGTCRC